jgi:hypothetical protein
MKKFILFVSFFLVCMYVNGQTLVRKGNNKYSAPIYNWDGTFLRKGNNQYSTPICNWDGVYIRQGNNKYNTPIYHWD